MDKEAQQLIAIGVMVSLILLGIGGCGRLWQDVDIEVNAPLEQVGSENKYLLNQTSTEKGL